MIKKPFSANNEFSRLENEGVQIGLFEFLW